MSDAVYKPLAVLLTIAFVIASALFAFAAVDNRALRAELAISKQSNSSEEEGWKRVIEIYRRDLATARDHAEYWRSRAQGTPYRPGSQPTGQPPNIGAPKT